MLSVKVVYVVRSSSLCVWITERISRRQIFSCGRSSTPPSFKLQFSCSSIHTRDQELLLEERAYFGSIGIYALHHNSTKRFSKRPSYGRTKVSRPSWRLGPRLVKVLRESHTTLRNLNSQTHCPCSGKIWVLLRFSSRMRFV